MGFRSSKVDMIPVVLAATGAIAVAVSVWAMFTLASIDPADVSGSGDSTVTGIGYCPPGISTVMVTIPVDCEAVCGSIVDSR